MEKRPLKNTNDEQKGYERATRDLMRLFTKLFIAAIVTVSLLACGMYLYRFMNKPVGIICMATATAGLLFAFNFSYKIQRYIAKHNQ